MNAKDEYLTFVVGQRTEEEAKTKLATLKNPETYQVLCIVDAIWIDELSAKENVIGYTIVRRGTV